MAVYADDGLVGAGDIARINGEVGNLPVGGVVVALRGPKIHAFLYGVLMGAGKGGEDEVSAIWVAFVDGHSRGALIDLPNGIQFRKLEAWVNALGIHVESHCDDVEIAGALTVAE